MDNIPILIIFTPLLTYLAIRAGRLERGKRFIERKTFHLVIAGLVAMILITLFGK